MKIKTKQQQQKFLDHSKTLCVILLCNSQRRPKPNILLPSLLLFNLK